MQKLIEFLKMHQKQLVRPWALSAPILVLLITIPLVRPFFHPELTSMSDDEQSRMATVQSIVENHSLAIDKTLFVHTTRQRVRIGSHWYSDQPPMLAALLSLPYWVLYHNGVTFEHNPLWVMFILTLIGVTIPVALSAGLIYKMGRLFELSRARRAILGFCVIAGSGLLCYATVINAHASGATLLIAAFACLVQVGLENNLKQGGIWLALSGVACALAATIDPPAAIVMCSLPLVILSMRWSGLARLGGIGIYLLGALLPLGVHIALNSHVTGDFVPAYLNGRIEPPRHLASADAFTDDDDQPTAIGPASYRFFTRSVDVLLGSHGVFTHFPVLILGVLGLTMVMHRHWPASTKMLASVTVGSSIAITIIYSLSHYDLAEAMFATRWFVLFLPLLVFWGGAWLRRPHRRFSWALAGILMGFSTMVSLVGATGPYPNHGFEGYTALAAARNLLNPPQPAAEPALVRN